MSNEENKHKIWLSCMQLSNCTLQQAEIFVKHANPYLFQPITPTGQNVLMVAASVGAQFVVQECLREGVQPNGQDMVGRTALHYAASIGSISIFEELVQKGANPLQLTIGGETPLTKACIFCQGDIIQWYLNNKIEAFEVADNFGKKPLEMLKLEGEELFSEVASVYAELTQSDMKD